MGWHDLSKHSEVTEKDFAFIEKVRSIDGVDSIQIDLTEIAIFIDNQADWDKVERELTLALEELFECEVTLVHN